MELYGPHTTLYWCKDVSQFLPFLILTLLLEGAHPCIISLSKSWRQPYESSALYSAYNTLNGCSSNETLVRAI